jgi:hypothetical protein
MGAADEVANAAASTFRRAGAWAMLAALLIAFGAYQVNRLMDRHLRFVDGVQTSLEATRDSISATARAIEHMAADNAAGRDAAVRQVLTQVDRCCPARR